MKRFSLNLRGRLVEFEHPAIMAIINATPDSFYSGARNGSAAEIERALSEGADILDIGAYSSRPGAADVSPDEEWARLQPVLASARRLSATIPISVDTFRPEIARRALSEGADIINDISGGSEEMDRLVAETRAPYVVMHMRGTPATMQTLTDYDDVTASVITFLARRVGELEAAGVHDIILDPGFGFAKTAEQNFELLRRLPLLGETLPSYPILAGLSRKSMFYKPLGLSADEVLPATCAANLLALQQGASIIRVHDVGAARQVIYVNEAR